MHRLSQNNWNSVEVDASQPLSSSLELQDAQFWQSSSEQRIVESPVPELPENVLSSDVHEKPAKEECLGCSSSSRALAFVLGLSLLIAALIVFPVIVTYSVTTWKTTTSTTTQSTTTTTTTTSATTTSTTTSTKTTSATTTTTTTSVCGTGCARIPVSSLSRLAYYKFESNTNDQTGTYPASGLSTPIYSTGYAGSALYFDGTPFEQLIAPVMNLSSRSFTIELWFYLTRIPTQDNAFFGQQSLANVGKYCLFLMSRLGTLYMGFYADDTSGTTLLQNATWYHAAFVYDNDQRQRSIYLNGVLDGQSSTGVGPYLGSAGSMTIGSAKIDGTIGKPFFSGYLDELMILTRVKSQCEILNDATLVAYFPFDGNYADAGPNSLPLTSSGASFMIGQTNQGVYLSGSTSYLQIGSLTSLGRSHYQYSIAFWVLPTVKGVLVHLSGNSSGLGWCTPLISFDLSGRIISQVYDTSSSIVLTGPSLSTTVWSHVVQTYSPINGQRLYIDGVLYASSSAAVFYQASGQSSYLNFGNMLLGTSVCVTPSPVVAVYQGGVDELRIYSRELSSIDVCLLSKP